MKNKVIIAVLVMLSGMTSCMDRELEGPVDSRQSDTVLAANPAFLWSTTKSVTVELEGLQLPVQVTRKLTLSTAEGGVFYSGMQRMNGDFSFTAQLPNHITGITMQYGEIEKSQDLNGLKVVFDFLTPTTDNGYLD